MKEGIPFEETKNEEVVADIETSEIKDGGLEDELKNINSKLEIFRSRLKTELKDATDPDALFGELTSNIYKLEDRKNEIVSTLIEKELENINSKLESYRSELKFSSDPKAIFEEISTKIIDLQNLKDELLSKIQDYE